jgi:hypothetical protein
MLSCTNAVIQSASSAATNDTERAKNRLVLDVVEKLNNKWLLESYCRKEVAEKSALLLVLVVVNEVRQPELRDLVRVLFEVLGDSVILLTNGRINTTLELTNTTHDDGQNGRLLGKTSGAKGTGHSDTHGSVDTWIRGRLSALSYGTSQISIFFRGEDP